VLKFSLLRIDVHRAKQRLEEVKKIIAGKRKE